MEDGTERFVQLVRCAVAMTQVKKLCQIMKTTKANFRRHDLLNVICFAFPNRFYIQMGCLVKILLPAIDGIH